MDFVNAPCWRAEDARAILRTEALEASRAVFLAVHSPIRGFEVSGVFAPQLREHSEEAVLEQLQREQHRHFFALVQGEPGSGKSHLIRWLTCKWDNPRDEVILVPRTGSLEGTLRHLRERLPERYRDLFAGLGQVHDTALAGRARDLHSRLANSLRADYFAGDLPMHADWANRYQLDRLVGHPQVLDVWRAPRRILNVLSGGGERDQETAEFTLIDTIELAHQMSRVQDRTIGGMATMAKNALGRQALNLQQLLDEGRSAAEVLVLAREHGQEIVRLKEALDDRFNLVVQDLVGVGRDALVRAFTQLRQRLAEDGRRLVLLLEDITSFQGVDNQLLDVLVARSDVREGEPICDMIAVVGLTNDYFTKAIEGYGNLRQRIDLHLRLSQVSHAGQLEQSQALATSVQRRDFVARYLRAIRAGKATVDLWQEHGGELDNVCLRCPHRAPCHLAFGTDARDIGLFPFTAQAVDRIYASLRDESGKMSLHTPRGIVQNVLSPLMFCPEKLADGEFPPSNLESANLPEGRLLGPIEQAVRVRSGGDDDLMARLRRLIAWWGPQNPSPVTSSDERGVLSYAGIPRGVYEAFGLPWPGGEAAQPSPPSPPSPPEPAPPQRSTQVPSASPSGKGTAAATREAGRKAEAASKDGKRPLTKNAMTRHRTELGGWVTGDRLTDPDFWSRLVFEILDGLPWATMGVPYWLRSKLFTEDTVALAGTRSTDTRHFVLPQEPWVSQGLDAWLVLRAREADGIENPEFYRRRVARFLRRLTRQVVEHCGEKTPRFETGEPWSPGRTAAQLLLLRAWLQKRVAMDMPLGEQWAMLFAVEGQPSESATNHTGHWKELVHRLSNFRESFDGLLRPWVTLASNPGQGMTGPIDAGDVAEALLRMDRELVVDCPPVVDKVPRKFEVWISLSQVGREAHGILPGLSRSEFNSVNRCLESIERDCGDLSIAEHLRSSALIVEQMKDLDHELPLAYLKPFQQAQRSLKDKNWQGTAGEASIQKLDDFLFETTPETRAQIRQQSRRQILVWILQAPIADITAMADILGSIETTLKELHRYTATLVAAHGSEAADPVALAEIGARVDAAAARIAADLSPREKA
ncbi:hypothetical protein [Nannocystis pusilla]|uniref:hypothetical protein n=1 Tax=Nannocystis pusilla TaxID=889268 RepID=UPI003BF24236